MKLLPTSIRGIRNLSVMIAALVAIYAAAGFLLLPVVVRSVLLKQLAARLTATPSLEKVEINPFALSVTLRGFGLAEESGTRIAGFDELYVNFELSSIVRRAWTFGEIRITRPNIVAEVRPDGTLNLASLLRPSPAPPPPEKPASEPPAVLIQRLSIIDGTVTFHDLSRTPPFEAGMLPVRLDLTGLSTRRDAKSDYSFSATTKEGEGLVWRGSVSLVPFASEGKLELKNVKVGTLWSYLRSQLAFGVAGGSFDLSADYHLTTGPTGDIAVDNGALDLRDLGITARGEDAVLIAVPRLSVREVSASLVRREAVVGRVESSRGAVTSRLDEKGNLNLQSLLAFGEPTAAQGAAAGSAARADAPGTTERRAAATGGGGSASSPAAADPQAGGTESAGASGGTGSAAARGEEPSGGSTGSPGGGRAGEPAGGPAASTTPETPRPWSLRLDDLELTDYSISFEDGGATPPVRIALQPLKLSVRGFTTKPGATLAVSLDTGIPPTGRVAIDGKTVLDPLGADLDVKAEGIDIRPLQPYVDRHAQLEIVKGRVGARGHFHLASASETGPRQRFTGAVSLSDFSSIDRALSKEFARWSTLDLEGIQLDMDPTRLAIARIAAHQPYLRVIVGPDRTLNLTKVLSPPGSAPPPEAAAEPAEPEEEAGEEDEGPAAPAEGAPSGPAGPGSATAPSAPSTPAAEQVPAAATASPAPGATAASPPPGAPAPSAAAPAASTPIKIDLVRIDDGSANFADLSLEPNFATGIQKLAGTIKGLSSDPAARAEVALEGQVDAYAPVKISGQMNPLSPTAFADLGLSFKNIELTTFTPYSGKFAGYRIEKGKLSLDLHYLLQNEQLDSQNKIFLGQLTLGERVDSPDATKLPVRLAVALLKDRHGNIDIDLPVRGSLKDPKFRYGKLILRALVHLLRKIVTSPFAAIGRLFGGSGEELGYVDFPAGASDLGEEAAKKLDTLRKGLIERPALTLEIEGGIDPDRDGSAIARARLKERIVEARRAELRVAGQPVPPPEDVVIDPPTHARLVAKLYTSAYGELPALEPSSPGGAEGSASPASQSPEGAATGSTGTARDESAAGSVRAAGAPAGGNKPAPRSKRKGSAEKVSEIPPPPPPDPAAEAARLEKMEARLLSEITLDPNDLRQLGQRRAIAVRDYLMKDGQVAAERLFITEPKPAVKAQAEGVRTRFTLSGG